MAIKNVLDKEQRIEKQLLEDCSPNTAHIEGRSNHRGMEEVERAEDEGCEGKRRDRSSL